MTLTDVDTRFDTMIERLNKLSVTNGHDAYGDIDWDAPENALDLHDGRLALLDHDPLAATDWYQALSPTEQAHLTLCRAASMMKIGLQFENLLQRGLLKLAWNEDNGSTLYRYAHHEVIEESQHSMMFQEFINRSGLPVRGMNRFWRVVGPPLVLGAAAIDQPMFFLMVLGGEEPVDYFQRQSLREGGSHPLIERVNRIHVTEEARHISFAKQWLHREMPRMNRLQRLVLGVHFPIVMGLMTRLMLMPSHDVRRLCGLPMSVVRDAYRTPAGRDQIRDSAAKAYRLADDLGLVTRLTRPLWKLAGLR